MLEYISLTVAETFSIRAILFHNSVLSLLAACPACGSGSTCGRAPETPALPGASYDVPRGAADHRRFLAAGAVAAGACQPAGEWLTAVSQRLSHPSP